MRIALVLIILFTSAFAYAHPGHDQSMWWKEPVHLLPVLYLIALVATAYAISSVTKKKTEKR